MKASITAKAFHLQALGFCHMQLRSLLFWDTYTAQPPRNSEHQLFTYYTQNNINCCNVWQ